MGFTLTENRFSTKDEVLAEVAALGWHAIELDVPAEHREASPACRAVFGFSIDPAEMTQPVNKPPAELS